MKKYSIVIMFVWLICSSVTFAQNELIKINSNLELIKLTDNAYIHVSYADLEGYVHFPANGFIYINKDEALIVDTPWNDEITNTLINYISDSLGVKVNHLIINHFHSDCMGGLSMAKQMGVKSHSSQLTLENTIEKNLPKPNNTFTDSLVIHLGGKRIVSHYLGGAHTNDNIVTWFPDEKILFGGCMLKALTWNSLGYTGDSDLERYPETLEKILTLFNDAEIVIPGHGAYDNLKIVKHTLELLKKRN